jgi:alcohol dehydrogenase YqhD (iron-dependent ADH family)
LQLKKEKEMENFVFHNPTKIIFGKDEIPNIGEEIAKKGYKKVLLVSGSGSIKNNGVYEQTVASLRANSIEWVEHWGVQPNPVLEHAREGVEIAKNENVDAILSVGGGSVIDECKAIAAGYYLNDVWDAYDKSSAVENALPLFVVLTLSATGSEMNAFSVLTKPDEKKKWAMGAKSLYPVCTIIDPEVQRTLPWRQTVNGAVDAMSHLMELYFKGGKAETTLAIDESMMRTLQFAIERLQKDDNDYIGRANLAWTATMALNGISALGIGGGEWAVHRIEHSISAFHPEVAHAEGLAILFPAWIKYVSELNEDHFERWAKNVWEAASIEEGINRMKETFHKWGAPVTLTEVGITESEIDQIAENAMQQGQFGSIKIMNKNDVINVLKLAV